MMLTNFVPEIAELAGIAVQPDVLWIPVGARVDELSPPRAVEVLRGAASALEARLAGVHPGARLSPGRLDLGGGAGDKSARSEDGLVGLDGLASLPLDPQADFWARAGLSARAVEALRDAARALSKAKPPIRIGWRNPVARVADAEAHRAALAARWNAHWRALTAGAAAGAPGDWDAPTEVIQIPVSLDEVRLALAPARLPARRSAGLG
ncbi:MAG: hypothetical protein IT372_26155 [Polyangiaceae bacterium]|nr:hypothetical protein [Polyangiaceae bacterium]